MPVIEADRVLVAYASAHGSTEGVALRIAAGLAWQGLDVVVRTAASVEDVSSYDAVILGSPVYNQRWLPGASEFVRRHAEALEQRRVWLFSVGSFGDTHRLIGHMMNREPRGIAEIREAVHPRDYRVFAGAIERSQWPLPSRILFHAFGGRMGDSRDWPAIDAWTDGIAAELTAAKV